MWPDETGFVIADYQGAFASCFEGEVIEADITALAGVAKNVDLPIIVRMVFGETFQLVSYSYRGFFSDK